jgi:hypothetical protein
VTRVGHNDGDTAGGIEAKGRVGDGVGNGYGAASREVAEAPREAASMAWHRGRRQRRGWENWIA